MKGHSAKGRFPKWTGRETILPCLVYVLIQRYSELLSFLLGIFPVIGNGRRRSLFFATNRGTLFFLTISMKLSTVNHKFDTLFFYIKTFLCREIKIALEYLYFLFFFDAKKEAVNLLYCFFLLRIIFICMEEHCNSIT